MPADTQTLRRCFEFANSGDIEHCRNLLIATSDGTALLEALCCMSREFAMPPTKMDYAEGFARNAKIQYPQSSAWMALGFLPEVDAWRTPSEVSLFIDNEASDPASGPFEAAARLLARVASCNYRIIKMHTGPGFKPTSTFTDLSLIGAVNLVIRGADTALEKFREGAPKAEETAASRRQFLGASYRPSADGGAADIRASCIAGEVLALRDLGRFGEMGDALKRLRAAPGSPKHLLAPLEAEAKQFASAAPFPSAWRKSFVDKLSTQPSPPAPAQSGSGGGGCMLPLAATLAGAGAAWWHVLQG